MIYDNSKDRSPNDQIFYNQAFKYEWDTRIPTHLDLLPVYLCDKWHTQAQNFKLTVDPI